VVDAVGQTPHLRVVALAGMGSQGLGQVDYVPQGLEHGAEQRQAAGATAGEAGSYTDELTCFAERADEVVSSGYLG